MKRIAVGLLLAAAPTCAWADCASLPYTLTNGTVANADQVMADLNCLALKGGTTFTGNIGVGNAGDWNALIEARKDQDAPTTGVVVTNLTQSANASAQVQLVSNTPYSYMFMTLAENNGSPYWRLNTGTGVQNAFYDMPNHVFRNQSGTERMRIASSGNVGIGTSTPSILFYVNGSAGGISAWQNLSDARLKTNIVPLTNALQQIQALNPVRFDWRQPADRVIGKTLQLPAGESQIGFLAQEVEKVVPEAVAKPADGSDTPYGLKEDNLIPVLVQAIKEQQTEIKEQQAEIKALQDQVAALKAGQ